MSHVVEPEVQRGEWSSERAFILSTAAAAVGLGNLWRFPYMAGENGGAAFVLAYLAALVVVGLPVMILELTGGRFARGSPVATFRRIHPWATAVGWLVVGLTAVILSYYLVITGWTLGYALLSFTADFPTFDAFTGGYASVWYFLAVLVLTAGLLLFGLQGVEKKALYTMPLLLAVILGLTVYGLTFGGGRAEAASFLLEPEFQLLASPTLWLLAFGQAFYSLAVGQGYLITYGSYLPRKVNVPRAAGTIAVIETGVALLAGWMIFPLVFAMGLAPDEGSELAFNTLPLAFDGIPAGTLVGILFFSLFFLAAFSSCIAGMKVVVTAIREELTLSQRKAVGLVAALVGLLGIPSALSFTPVNLTLLGRPFLEVMDALAATQVVVICGVAGGAVISWLIPPARLAAKLGSHRPAWAYGIIWVARLLFIPAAVALVGSWWA